MRFTQAHAYAQCSPTRAAFLSGQYGARNGVFKVLNEKEPSFAPMRSAEAKDALGPETTTLATTLRKAGYWTGISGKWHIANNHAVAALRRGEGYFDSYGFDFAGPANSNEHHEDKTVTAITDDIIGFIESQQTLVCLRGSFQSAHKAGGTRGLDREACRSRLQAVGGR